MSATLRVLVVEDVEEEAVLIVRTLRRDGAMPTWRRVDTSAALRAALTDQAWDIVIADYFMPALNGIEALAIVRTIAPGVPFILVSGTIGERIAVEAMRAGAQDYFVKGKIDRLPLAVERELQDAATRRQRAAADDALDALQRQFDTLARAAPDKSFTRDLQDNVSLSLDTLKRILDDLAQCGELDPGTRDSVEGGRLVVADLIEQMDRLWLALRPA